MQTPWLAFSCGLWGLNSGLCACMARTLETQSSRQPPLPTFSPLMTVRLTFQQHQGCQWATSVTPRTELTQSRALYWPCARSPLGLQLKEKNAGYEMEILWHAILQWKHISHQLDAAAKPASAYPSGFEHGNSNQVEPVEKNVPGWLGAHISDGRAFGTQHTD